MIKLIDFIKESNRIEGIIRPVRESEIVVHREFIGHTSLRIQDFVNFVNVIQPGAQLRSNYGMDVGVGNWLAPHGGDNIPNSLANLIRSIPELSPHEVHCRYLTLHPFMDGNGRSARALWLRMMIADDGGYRDDGFLQTFYYQTLAANDEKSK